jgi:aryl-alcohol dehydrogenase-like predicted oxidoreductase
MDRNNHPPAVSALALGTAQFGSSYGIVGSASAVPDSVVRQILEHAAAHKVSIIDTAAAYGDIEDRLATLVKGLPFNIVSKIPLVPDELDPEAAARYALASAVRSLDRLGASLRTLMLHRSADLTGARGAAIFGALSEWASKHAISLGVSAYAPAEAAELARRLPIEVAQVPGNAFDQRVTELPPQPGFEVHLRSAFLQGLLLMPVEAACIRLPVAADALRRWHSHCLAHGRSPLEAALSIVKSFAAVSAVVVGVDSLEHWTTLVEAWEQTSAQSASELAIHSSDITDPRRWRLAA